MEAVLESSGAFPPLLGHSPLSVSLHFLSFVLYRGIIYFASTRCIYKMSPLHLTSNSYLNFPYYIRERRL